MKRAAIILFSLLFSAELNAQTGKTDLINQINADIWIPFIKGVNENRPDLYNSTLAPDFYWVSAGAKTRIMNFQEYVDDAAKVMNQRTGKSVSTKLEIRFLERNVNESFASEKTIIKWTSQEKGKEPAVAYGIAQVFSKRVNGVWRKYVQYVYAESSTAEVYENAVEM